MPRPAVADIRALKGKRMLNMLYVETADDAYADFIAGLDAAPRGAAQ